MTPHPRTLIAIISALGLTLTLSACGSKAWTTESVEAALLMSSDFDFDVSRAEEDPAFQKDEDGDVLFWSGEDCPANARVLRILKRGEMLGGIAYEERSDDQSDFTIKQQVFQLESEEDVTEILDILTATLKDDECASSDYNSSSVLTSYINSDYDNVRDLKDAYGLEVPNSLVWDTSFAAAFSGAFNSGFEEEGGAIVAPQGNAILIVQYETDTDDDVADRVTRRDLEDAVEKSLLRFFS